MPPRIPRPESTSEIRPPPITQRIPHEVRDLLVDLPPPTEPAAPEPDRPPDPAALREAVRVGAVYEQQLRDSLAPKREEPKSFFRRNALALALAGVAVLAAGAGLTAYRLERAANLEEDLARYLGAARNGLARDTLAAYQASLGALDEVLERSPGNQEAASLRAQTLATLAVIYGAADPREAEDLLEAVGEGGDRDATLTARWLLAPSGEARLEIEEELLRDPPPEGVGASVLSLSGAVLLARGEPSLAIARFNAAILAGPGHVPTLVRVGDYYRARSEHAEALRYYSLALAVAEDHPGALLGAAESTLTIAKEERELEEALAWLDKLQRPEQVPLRDRRRLSLARARLRAATGDREGALRELGAVTTEEDPPAMVELIQTYVRIGAADEGLRRFHDFDPEAAEDSSRREAYAKMLVAAERYREAAALKARPGERGLLLQIGIAQYRLGQMARARSSLHATVLKGKLPVDAVVYLGLVDLANGRVAKARKNLERLGSGSTAKTTGRWAWAAFLLRQGNGAEAERVLREAIEADPRTVEPHCALGRLLLDRGELPEALERLRKAAQIAPLHSEARRALGKALALSGDLAGATEEWEAVLNQHPQDPEAAEALTDLLLRQDQIERAQVRVQALLRAFPKHAPALRALDVITQAREAELAKGSTQPP